MNKCLAQCHATTEVICSASRAWYHVYAWRLTLIVTCLLSLGSYAYVLKCGELARSLHHFKAALPGIAWLSSTDSGFDELNLLIETPGCNQPVNFQGKLIAINARRDTCIGADMHRRLARSLTLQP